MRFLFITLFPEQIEQAVSHSIIKRGIEKGLIEVSCINPREFTTDKHRTVDDTPFGGGAGMVMMPQPIASAIDAIDKEHKARRIFMSPRGRTFKQSIVLEYGKLDRMLLLCGHYEGVDIVITHAFFPVVAAAEKADKDGIPLFGWQDDGLLTMCNGPTVNHADVVNWFKEMKRKGVTVLGHWGKTSAILWCITLVGASTIFAMPEQDAVVIRIEKQITATGDTIYSDSEVKDWVSQLRSEGKLELVNGLLIELEADINVTEVVKVSPHDTLCLDEKTVQIIAQMYRNNPKALYEALGRPQPTEKELAKKRIKAKEDVNKHLYSHRLRKHLGLSKFLPAPMLKFVDTFMLTYSFGDIQKHQGSPIFEVGAICTYFKNFLVLTMDTTTIAFGHEQYEYAPGYFPTITGWMLKNCDTYWMEWQIEHNGGVVADTDDKKNATLSAKERAKVKSTIKQLRAKYERTFTSGEFIENTNADKIFVVQLPHLEEIKNVGTLNDRIIREKVKNCYAVEFYKKGRKDAIRMLIFTYEEVSIETILSKISKYIQFE